MYTLCMCSVCVYVHVIFLIPVLENMVFPVQTLDPKLGVVLCVGVGVRVYVCMYVCVSVLAWVCACACACILTPVLLPLTSH